MKRMVFALLPEPAIADTGERFVSCKSMLTGSTQRVRGHFNLLPWNNACYVDMGDFSAGEKLEKRYLGLRSGSAGCAVALDESVRGHVTDDQGTLRLMTQTLSTEHVAKGWLFAQSSTSKV